MKTPDNVHRPITILFLCLGFYSGKAQGEWNLLKDKDSIRISSRTSAKSGFNDVRVQMDLPGTSSDVVNAVWQVKEYQNWAYATKNSYPVKRAADSSLIYYSEIVAPWPVSNRDLYASISVRRDSLSKHVFIVCSGMPKFQAERDRLVRIPYSKAIWELTDISPKRVHLDYVLEINPGGNVPAWVMNMFISKGPYVTFSHLRALLQQKRKT